MKAIVTRQYGSVEVLEVSEVDTPVLKDDEILVKVNASSVNPVDWKVRKGEVKVLTGSTPPQILGGDYAGVISKIGQKVNGYRVGEAVFGLVNAFKGGAYGEYVKVNQDQICHKPENLNFEEAASLPLVSLTAYQSLVNEANIKAGDHVMINGCSSGVGISAIQIAKALGGQVTGVCSARNLELVKKFGVDRVLDYTKEDILNDQEAYDIFYDAVAKLSFSKVAKTLKQGGTYVTTLPSVETIFLAPIINPFRSKKAKKILVRPDHQDLLVIKKLAEEEKLIPLIEKTYPIEDIREAHTRSETGRVVGKLVLQGFSG